MFVEDVRSAVLYDAAAATLACSIDGGDLSLDGAGGGSDVEGSLVCLCSGLCDEPVR